MAQVSLCIEWAHAMSGTPPSLRDGLLFVTLAWVPFRAVTLEATMAFLRALIGAGGGKNLWIPSNLVGALLLVIGGHVVGVLMERRPGSFAGAFVVACVALTIYYFGAGITPFIYFQF
jgi:hypothetical protein